MGLTCGRVPEAHADRAGRRPWVALGVARRAARRHRRDRRSGAPDDLGDRLAAARRGPRQPAADAELVVARRGATSRPTRASSGVSQDVVVAQLEADPAVTAVRAESSAATRCVLIADVRRRIRGRARGGRDQARRADRPRRRCASASAARSQRQLEARRELGDELWRTRAAGPAAGAAAGGDRAVGWRAAAPVLCAGDRRSRARSRSCGLIGARRRRLAARLRARAVVGLVLGVELPAARAGRARRARRSGERSPGSDRRRDRPSLPGLAPLATPLDQAASLALGCALAAILAAAATLLVAPAIGALVDERCSLRPPAVVDSATPRGDRVRARVGGLAALAVPAVLHGTSRSRMRRSTRRGSPPPSRPASWRSVPSPATRCSRELPLAAALATVGWRSPSRRWRDGSAPWPGSAEPAARGRGGRRLRADRRAVGRPDRPRRLDGVFFDTGAVAIAVCAAGGDRCAPQRGAGARAARRAPADARALGAVPARAGAARRAARWSPVAPELGIALAAGLVCRLPAAAGAAAGPRSTAG